MRNKIGRFGIVATSLYVSVLFLSLCIPLENVLASPTSATATLWPTEVTSKHLSPTHNTVWGSAIDSDVRWTFTAAGMPLSNMIAIDGLVYLGTDNSMYAFNAITGEVVWRYTADNWMRTDAVVADGKIFTGTGNRFFPQKPKIGAGTRATGPTALYALNSKTGALIWKYPIGGGAMPTPVYKDGKVYYVTGERILYAMNADNGELLYKYNLGSIVSMSSPVLYGDILMFGGAYPSKFFGFNIKTQQMAWETVIPEVYTGIDDVSAAADNNMVFFNAVADNDSQSATLPPRHKVYALNTQNGDLVWSFDTGPGYLVEDNKADTPVVLDGTVYIGSSLARKFYALDENTGEKKWAFNIGNPTKGAPIIQGNYLFFGDTKGVVYALDRNTGKYITEKAFGGAYSPQGPTLFNGTIYIANQNRKVYAFPALDLVTKSLQAPIASNSKPSGQYFDLTGHFIDPDFYNYWQQNGGLAKFGYPITETFDQFHSKEGRTYKVQYFERERFELHDGVVELGLLGNELTVNQVGKGPFQPISADASGNNTYYSLTGHSVLPQFNDYWYKNGGLAYFGYPISEPFDQELAGGEHIVTQYFERARFELHTTPTGSIVLLGLLGREKLNP